jgi:hypothetical protein
MAHSLVFKHIPSEDINATRFQTFKRWESTHTNFSSSFGIQIWKGTLDEDWGKYDYPYGFMRALANPDGRDQKSLWYQVNGMYYKDGKNNLDIEYSPYMLRRLHDELTYVQLPQQYTGEGIKLGSINIENGYDITIKDDKLGNLLDVGLNTGSMVPSDNLLAYWGFNEKFKYRQQLYKRSHGQVENVFHHSHLEYKNISFAGGIQTTGTVLPSGLKAEFDGSGYMWLEDTLQQYNFDFKADFSISLWFELPTNQTNITGSTNFIVSKQGDVVSTLINKKSNQLPQWDGYESEGVVTEKKIYIPYLNQKYPFAIKVHNQSSATPGRIEVSKCDLQNTPTIISPLAYNDGQEHHLVFQKNGNDLELWIDGIKRGSSPDTTLQSRLNTHNDAILSIGSEGYNRGQLTGCLDEIRIYDRSLSKKEILSLGNNDYNTGTAYNTAIVGNVFYPEGTFVISDPRPKYKNVLVGNNFDYTSSLEDNFKINYRSTLTMTEQEVLCRVAPGDFNFTSNPTIREYNDMSSPDIKPYATSSDWHPYVTTIGLYDEFGRMLAIGKAAQAIPIYDNVETTIIVRYDE